MSSIPNNPGSPQTYPGARMASHATSLQAGAPMDSSQVPFYVFNTHEEAENAQIWIGADTQPRRSKIESCI
jgi:hypothetical protein